MVGVGYGKGATLPDEEVRWLTPEQVDGLRAGEGVRLLDARDAPEFQKASLPGAESLPQSTLMFSRGKVQALVDELVGSQAGELCFFANTAGQKKERKQTTQGRDGRTARRHHTGI